MDVNREGFGAPDGVPVPLPAPDPSTSADVGLSAGGEALPDPVGVGAALGVSRSEAVQIPPGGRLRRQDGGRRRAVYVRLSGDEYAELAERAERARVSIQRLLVESTLTSGGATMGERSAHYTQLKAVLRLLANATNNLNQVTRWSHAHEQAHEAIDEAVAEVEAAAARVRSVARSHTLVPRSKGRREAS